MAQQQNMETLLVDLDVISSTASEWSAIRDRKGPLVVTAQLADVEALREQAKHEGFDLLILDFPPYFSDDCSGCDFDYRSSPDSRFTEVSGTSIPAEIHRRD